MHQSTLPCDFALPAEWEPQSAIMLTWPHAGTDWKPYLPEITDTYLELADIITRYEQLLVATPDVPATRYQLKKKLSAEQHIDPAYQPFGDGHAAEKICDILRETKL